MSRIVSDKSDQRGRSNWRAAFRSGEIRGSICKHSDT